MEGLLGMQQLVTRFVLLVCSDWLISPVVQTGQAGVLSPGTHHGTVHCTLYTVHNSAVLYVLHRLGAAAGVQPGAPCAPVCTTVWAPARGTPAPLGRPSWWRSSRSLSRSASSGSVLSFSQMYLVKLTRLIPLNVCRCCTRFAAAFDVSTSRTRASPTWGWPSCAGRWAASPAWASTQSQTPSSGHSLS